MEFSYVLCVTSEFANDDGPGVARAMCVPISNSGMRPFDGSERQGRTTLAASHRISSAE